jgi:hypothetical protein
LNGGVVVVVVVLILLLHLVSLSMLCNEQWFPPGQWKNAKLLASGSGSSMAVYNISDRFLEKSKCC